MLKSLLNERLYEISTVVTSPSLLGVMEASHYSLVTFSEAFRSLCPVREKVVKDKEDPLEP